MQASVAVRSQGDEITVANTNGGLLRRQTQLGKAGFGRMLAGDSLRKTPANWSGKSASRGTCVCL